MKKTISILVTALFLSIALVGYTCAMPVAAGDAVTFVADDNTNYAGNYLFHNETQDADFSTFCVERNEHIYYGGKYEVADISLGATAGGYGHDNDGESNDTIDYISKETQWLYYSFISGTLEVGGTTNFNTHDGVTALQNAFWFLEDEFSSETQLTGLADELVRAAIAKIATGNFDLGYVRVMNILYATDVYNSNNTLVHSKGDFAQSQLVGAPVPEPATLILLGSGLAGLAFYRRRMKK